MSNTNLRTDILSNLLEDLDENQQRVFVEILEKFRESSTATTGFVSSDPKRSATIEDFTDLVLQVINDFEIQENTISDRKIIFSTEKPPVKSQSETITYAIIRREPGHLGQGPPFQGGRQELKPHVRRIIPDKNNPNYHKILLGQFFDNEVEFTCWAKTSKAANARALWFEDVIRRYQYFFVYKGIRKVLFSRRLRDDTEDIDGNLWQRRKLVYYVRTEDISEFSEPDLKRIIVNLGIGK
jgi:hypothetical protein